MIAFARQINRLIEPRGRKKIGLIFVLTLLTGIFEVAGIASIMPFIAVLSRPELVQSHFLLNRISHWTGFSNVNHFLVFLGVCALALMVMMNAINTVAQWAVARFTFMQGDYISRRLFAHYLNKPYTYFLNRNSADMAKEIQTETRDLVEGLLFPFVVVVVRALISLFIFGFLVWVDPVLAAIMFGFLGGTYGLVYLLVHQKLRRVGEIRTNSLGFRYKVAAEALSGIKEIKLSASEGSFISLYERPSVTYARAHSTQNIISQLPRYAVETTAFAGIMVIVLYLVLTHGSFDTALPVIAVYALAAQRILPAMQRIFNGVTSIRSYSPVLDRISAELAAGTPPATDRRTVAKPERPFRLADTIVMDRLTFAYEGASSPVISDLSLTIKANSTIGFVGPTGSGKTTLVDLIMGLLLPDKGRILVDGRPLTAENLRAWQTNFGYVPQQIHLIDESVACNIAFGIPKDQVDMKAVERAARAADIHDFVVGELPRGYSTVIGENGVRLSGGQRQRVGIARALYKDPSLLVLDEATSALDDETESAVMDAITNLNHQKTILIIAHRMGTVGGCDEIVEIKRGEIWEIRSKGQRGTGSEFDTEKARGR